MGKGILGKKLGMLQLWDSDGKQVAVTVIEAGPCAVTQVKTKKKEGYNSIQIGFQEKPRKRITRALQSHQKGVSRSETDGKMYSLFREIVDFSEDRKVGDIITCGMFQPREKVSVRGIGKGKGFQGVVKLHGFGGGRSSHGSRFHRETGSVGAGTDPSRVVKGKKMPARMGGKTKTVINLEVVQVILEENLILVKGGVPGIIGSSVFVYQG